MINRNAKREATPLEKMFEERKLSHTELQDFHAKIQKFWGEEHVVKFPDGSEAPARKFFWDELTVFFGACNRYHNRKLFRDNATALEMAKNGEVFQYAIRAEMTPNGIKSKRHDEFMNLWRQYEDWGKKQDWVEEKRAEELEHMASEIPF